MLGLTQILMLSVLFHDPGIRLDDNITATASALLTQNIMIHTIKIWTSPIHDKLLFKMHIWNSSGQLFGVRIRNYILFWNLKLEWYLIIGVMGIAVSSIRFTKALARNFELNWLHIGKYFVYRHGMSPGSTTLSHSSNSTIDTISKVFLHNPSNSTKLTLMLI